MALLTDKRKEILYDHLPEDWMIEPIHGGTFVYLYSIVIYIPDDTEWVIVRSIKDHKWWVSPCEVDFLPQDTPADAADIGPYTRLREAAAVMLMYNSCKADPVDLYKKRLELNNECKN